MQGQPKQTKAKNAPYCTARAVQLTGYTSQEENLHEQIQLKSQVKKLHGQVQQLRILCVLSYVFVIGVGVVIWMIS